MDFDKYDYMAIDWINKNIRRIEPILEAPGQKMYSGVSRISIFTGMPTLIGWGYQVGQQSGRRYNTRITNAATIYRTPSPETALSMLKAENIGLVYVGTIEKKLYPGNPEKFEKIGDVIYKNEGAVLYRITK